MQFIDILRATANVTGVSVEEMKSKRRTNRIARARWVATYIARHDLRLSLPYMGHALCRDHTSILWGLQRMEFFHLSPEKHPWLENIAKVREEAINTNRKRRIRTLIAVLNMKDGVNPVDKNGLSPILESCLTSSPERPASSPSTTSPITQNLRAS